MRNFSARHDSRLQNLLALLTDFEARGLVCGVHDDGAGAFFVKGKRSLLQEWERESLEDCRDGLREAWLLRADRCTRCGLDPATRPNTEGKVCIGVVFNEEKQKLEQRWGKCNSVLYFPFLCADCYDDPRTWNELAGTELHARSAQKSNGIVFTDEDDAEDGEAETAGAAGRSSQAEQARLVYTDIG